MSFLDTVSEIENIDASAMRWCASHDWYLEAGILASGYYKIIVRDDEAFCSADTPSISFTNLEQLKQWAGY